MKLYFVRHGESEANVLNIISNRGRRHGLTEKGRQQATELAGRLAGAGITSIYTSLLLRARQTASILSGALGPAFLTTHALREFDCGVAEGRSDPEAWRLHSQLVESWLQQRHLEARIEGGENFLDMRDRFVPFIERLVHESADTSATVLVGHGGLYLCLLPLILANIEPPVADRFPNAGYVLAETRPAGLVCLEWCGQSPEATTS